MFLLLKAYVLHAKTQAIAPYELVFTEEKLKLYKGVKIAIKKQRHSSFVSPFMLLKRKTQQLCRYFLSEYFRNMQKHIPCLCVITTQQSPLGVVVPNCL